MLHIALCDDEQEQLSLIDGMLRQYNVLHPELNLRVWAFSSGAALLEHMRISGAFDLYLLDVIMPGEDGIQLGLKIRESDQCGRIFYLTSSADYAVDSYLPKASCYLLKPVKKERLFTALDEEVESWAQNHRAFITVKTRNGLQRLSVYAIVYGELVGRCVQYHLSDGSIVTGMSLRTSFREAVSPLLNYPQFVLCAASFFVNLSFVEMVEPRGLRLRRGGVLPLSRTLRTEVTNQWLDYHLQGGKDI